MDFARYLDRSIGLAEGLVNSHMPDGTHVTLDDPRALERLIRANGFSPDHTPTRRDLAEVERLRARLREAFEAPDEEGAARVLNAIVAETSARPELVDHDRRGWHLHYVPDSATVARRLAAETAVALATVVVEHGFARLRVCEWETCRDVFVDRSRNHSRRFCSPDVCGNRASVAAWRSRQRRRPGTPSARSGR
jgi:predicted RNA-binding Zn ribbon-like protein